MEKPSDLIQQQEDEEVDYVQWQSQFFENMTLFGVDPEFAAFAREHPFVIEESEY